MSEQKLIDLPELQRALEASFSAAAKRPGAGDPVAFTNALRDCFLSSTVIVTQHLATRIEKRLAELERTVAEKAAHRA